MVKLRKLVLAVSLMVGAFGGSAMAENVGTIVDGEAMPPFLVAEDYQIFVADDETGSTWTIRYPLEYSGVVDQSDIIILARKDIPFEIKDGDIIRCVWTYDGNKLISIQPLEVK